jgi:hypothetical protein
MGMHYALHTSHCQPPPLATGTGTGTGTGHWALARARALALAPALTGTGLVAACRLLRSLRVAFAFRGCARRGGRRALGGQLALPGVRVRFFLSPRQESPQKIGNRQ